MKTKIIPVSLATLVITLASLSMTPYTYAAENTTTPAKEGFFMGLIHKIMNTFRFGYNKQNIETLPSSDITPPDGTPMTRPNDATAKKESEEERLTKLVSEGKITEAQKSAILAELKALQTKYSIESMKDLSEEERQTQMKTIQDELTAWAKEQGIDISSVMPTGPGGQPGQQPPQNGQGRLQPPKGSPKPTPTK